MRRLLPTMLALILGAAVIATPAVAQQPGIAGDLPAQGGVALVTWGGGPVADLDAEARDGGCRLVSAWATVAGGLVGHVVGAPAFVNADFAERVGEDLPAGTPLLLRCSRVPSAGDGITFASTFPDWIEGLDAASETELEPYSYYATWPVIAGYDFLGEELEAVIQDRRDAFEEAIGDPVPGSPIVQELNISFDFIVGSGTVIGLHMQRYEFFGANGRDVSETIWFDTASSERLLATALLANQDALEALAALAREALERDRPDLSLPDVLEEGTAPTEENYDSIGFNAEGDLVVEFDEYQVGPGASGAPRVVIPADLAAPLLSDFGERAQEEVMSPSGSLTLPGPTEPQQPSEPTVTPPSGAVNCIEVACIALTFDDGPARSTSRLLDLLAQHGARATFFVVGSNVPYRPELLRRMVDEGHEVGNHTMDHRDLTKLGPDELTQQVAAASAAIKEATGVAPRFLRPPYGAVNDEVSASVGLPLVLWSVDPRDWADPDVPTMVQRVTEGAQRGAIVLLHDIHETTVDAMPAILDELARRGLTPVTVSELLGGGLVPGQVYRQQ